MSDEKTKSEVLSDAQMAKETQTTGDILKKQDKKKIKIWMDPHEKKRLEDAKESGKKVEWPFEVVSINGYTYQIQKGIEVEVPKSVAEVLENAGVI